MRVLVACEYSGIVRDAFLAKGHDAWSCDLLPTEKAGPHVEGNVQEILGNKWDMIVAFPPCTHLASSGAQYWPRKRENEDIKKAIQFVWSIYDSADHVAIENPVGILSTAWRKPNQIIQPYQFGHEERKTTCLWLKGLPELKPTNIVEAKPKGSCTRKIGSKAGKQYQYYYHQGKSAKERARTFQGIADAMANQWGTTPPPGGEDEH